MTGPDGTQFDNNARVRGSGTAFQAGEIQGDASMGNTDNSRSTTISLGAFGVIAGVVMTVLVGFAVWKFIAPGGSTGGPPVTAQSGSATTSGHANAQLNGPAKEVRLNRRTGVDVDGDDTSAKSADGANGAIDLYVNENNYMYANGNDFSTDRGNEEQAQQRCTKAATTEKKLSTVLPLSPGEQYCFVTSDGQIGWLRVKSSTLLDWETDSSTVLAVRVWARR